MDEEGLAYRIDPEHGQAALLDPRLPRTDGQTRLITSVHFGLVMLVPVQPDNFLGEAYALTAAQPAALPPSTITTTQLPQPDAAARASIVPGMTNLDLLSRLGRPYEADSRFWYYGGPERRDDKPAYDFKVGFDGARNVSWIGPLRDRSMDR
ncbi:hypothetical protein ACERK3_19015 [Phycisphaerales bacterium AB-hyl4]|uniref:Uncharacterized protein n=1 Tax=Natronomicrosphaera hydrolytica TaxID=3242702 RepID=A0ABV4UAL9_9BACT